MGFKLISNSLAIAVSSYFMLSASVYANESDDNLVIWTKSEKSFVGLDIIGKRFTKETNLKVLVENFDQVEVKYKQSVVAGKGPDIFIWPHDRIADWVIDKLIEPVSISPFLLNNLYPKSVEAITYEGTQYGYPIALEAISNVCNMDLIDQVPSTFEDIERIQSEYNAKNTYQTDKYVVALNYREPYYAYPIMGAFGAYSFKKTSNGWDKDDIGIAKPEAIEGVNYIVNLVKKNIIPSVYTANDAIDLFLKGKAACVFTGPWSWNLFKEKHINYTVNQLPTIKNKPLKPYVGVLVAHINPNSKHKNEAKKFLENYLITKSGLKAINEDKPIGNPALVSYEEELERNNNTKSIYLQSINNIENGVLMPTVKPILAYWTALNNAIRVSISGEMETEDALKQAEARIRSYRTGMEADAIPILESNPNDKQDIEHKAVE
ncbi:MAG: maltose/maltodextrin ABC transporter substrate-binding protein MalE [Succinivibrionaceae bacterium]